MVTRFLLAGTWAFTAFAACAPVTGNRILGRDLAAADPRFSRLPATLTVGYPPAPGATRVFGPAELERLARANGLSITDPHEVCFEVPMRKVQPEELFSAMRSSLPREAELKILETAQSDVPYGELHFPVEGLEPPSPTSHGEQFWRGYVAYGGTLKAPFWARVAISVKSTVIVPAHDLPPDVPIRASDLQVKEVAGVPGREKMASAIDEAAGLAPKRMLKAGLPVPLAALAQPAAIHKGDAVRVEVRSGLAHVRFEAIAESAAREGEMVALRNPANGKTFRARVDSSTLAVVDLRNGNHL